MMLKILSHFISLPPFLPVGFARIDQILQKNVAGTLLKGCPKFSEWHS
jgi:hypothetical protein